MSSTSSSGPRTSFASAAVLLAVASCAGFAFAFAFASGTARADESSSVSPPPVARARDIVAGMETASARVRSMLRRARAAAAPPREIACLDESLSRADVIVRSGRELSRSVVDAWARGDRVAASQSLAELTLARERGRHAATVADRCAPSDGSVAIGTTTVRVVVDGAVPADADVFARR